MYIDHIEIENFRTFRKSRISFCHADQDFSAMEIPKPKAKNLNLLLTVDAVIIPQVLQYAFWAETNPDSIKSLWLEAATKPDD